jgi:chitin-binding protein
MTVRGARVGALLGVVVLVGLLSPGTAHAHGAPQNPISRAVACGPEGGQRTGTPACVAAINVSGGFEAWDNIRVANVAGRDREVIPDGKLCSGGIARYHGLDLARADWPSTTLTSGATYSFSYRETIPHDGTFRMYVTKDSYDATKVLRWADLETAPFLTATDPTLRGNAYVMSGRLPGGKTGRHLIFTIWQNSSTADTYYSCSDVVFVAPAAAPVAGASASAVASVAASVVATSPDAVTPTRQSGAAVQQVSGTSAGGGLPLLPIAVVAVLAVFVVVGLTVRRRRG